MRNLWQPPLAWFRKTWPIYFFIWQRSRRVIFCSNYVEISGAQKVIDRSWPDKKISPSDPLIWITIKIKIWTPVHWMLKNFTQKITQFLKWGKIKKMTLIKSCPSLDIKWVFFWKKLFSPSWSETISLQKIEKHGQHFPSLGSKWPDWSFPHWACHT